MPDRIDNLVRQASAARLSRLFTMLSTAPAEAEPDEARPSDTDGLWRRLRDPAAIVALLAPIVPVGGGTAGELVALVLDPASSLASLQSTFALARDCVARADDVQTRATAELLYQSAAAAALTRHGAVLGRRSMTERSALYARLARQLTDGPFSQLFAAAAIASERSAGSSNPRPGA